MTILASILANSKTFGPATGIRTGTRRVIFDQLRGIIDSVGDFPVPAAAAAVAEVQVMPVYNGDGFTGGTLKLGFGAFQTAAMAFDISTAGVQAAVDAAWLANVPGYKAGDISAQGGPWTAQDIILVYEGELFQTTPPSNLAVMLNMNLVGDGIVAESYIYAGGLPLRRGYGALIALGIVSIGALPAVVGADPEPSTITVPASGDGNRFPHGLDTDTVRALVLETSIEEGNDTVSTVLLAKLGL